jgi:hypothetical protein
LKDDERERERERKPEREELKGNIRKKRQEFYLLGHNAV